MLIDWFTVVAQLINFLVLVWLMKRFLYRPILDAIDAREHRIAATLADAAAKSSEAEQARDAFLHQSTALDQQRDDLLNAAKAAAQAERKQLLAETQQAADALDRQRREALLREHQQLKAELARLTRDEVFAITRKVLTELSGDTLEARMSEVFAERLQGLDPATRDELVSALANGSDPVRVRSVFELPAPQRQTIQTALEELFATEVPVTFETTPTLINGLELSVNGRKLGWNIADYLTDMETRISALLALSAGQTPADTNPKPGAKASEAPQ